MMQAVTKPSSAEFASAEFWSFYERVFARFSLINIVRVAIRVSTFASDARDGVKCGWGNLGKSLF
jgi:hypothetical protein